jgi:VWFA-related protein
MAPSQTFASELFFCGDPVYFPQMTRVMLVACALVTIGVAGVPATPQQTPQRPPVFRSATELVEIDVVVVDKAGQRVHGLTRDDFVLKDRKKPQLIETFTEVQREIERATELPRLPAETRVDVAANTSAKAGRLIVLVLDDLHVWHRRTDKVKEIARKIVGDLGPDSSMALIQTGGEHGVEVTDDRTRLLASVEKFKGRRPVARPLEVCEPIAIPHDPETVDASNFNPGCEIQDINANRGLLRALEDAARMLGRGDKRRKAFILVSENVAKDISGLFDGGEQIADIVDAGGYHSGNLEHRTKAAPSFDYNLLNTMNAMRRGNVATYSIDPRGLITPQKLMEECFPPTRGEQGIGTDPCVGDQARGSPTDWNSWVRKAQHGLEIMSEETGGFAVVNTDDFTGGIAQIISDLDNYYLLGFYTTDTKSKGYRPIDVEVKGRPDLKLRYRQGYQIEGAPPAEKETDELSRLIGGALPSNGLPLRLHAIPMPGSDSASPGKDAKVTVTLELTVPTQSMKTADTDRLLDDIRYGLYAVDLKGAKIRERTGKGAKVALRPRPGLAVVPDKVTYQIVSEMQLAPGQYQMRASATSDKLSAGGSVYLSFEVPDFSKVDLRLTDLVLAYADGPHVPIARDLPVKPGVTSSTREAPSTEGPSSSVLLRAPAGTARPAAAAPAAPVPAAQVAPPVPVLPFDPTLDRVFTPRDTLRLFFKAVQGKPQQLKATISALNPDGEVMATFDRTLPAERQPSLDIQLPLAQLAPGAYRLQVKVTDGAITDVREVAFVVK